jgi:predicted DNA-binding transcriptional regulator YafY
LNIISLTSIPSRLAEIVLALREKKRLSVAGMRQITGASGNTLVRNIKILKLLGSRLLSSEFYIPET